MTCHVAIDLGAGSGRAMLGRIGPDDLVVTEVHRFRYAPRPMAGRLRWDVARLVDGVSDGLLAAGAAAASADARITSVGVDSWGVDYGLIAADGRLLEEPICYRDGRTDGVMARVFAVVPREEIFRRTGIQFHQLNTLYQLAAHVRDGLPPAAAHLLLMPDLCHHHLCGAVASERTDASTTQLLDVRTAAWDEDLFGRLGLPLDLMPPVVATGTDLGPIADLFARSAGLDGARVVAPPTHDTASAVAATPLEAGWAYISSGTWSLVGVEIPEPIVGDAALAANFTNEAGAFGTIRFLKNVMGLWLLEGCRRDWAEAGPSFALPDLLARAAAIRAFPGLVVPDDPRFFNPPSMTREVGAVLEASGQTRLEDPVLVARAIFDSLALRYASVVESIERVTGRAVRGIHVVGGGSLNDCLNQATADATGLPVLAGPVEAAATGNLLVQAIAAGTLPSLAAGRALVRAADPPRRFEPHSDRPWAEAAARYRQLEEAVLG